MLAIIRRVNVLHPYLVYFHRFGKRAPMRFGKRAPMRFGKRDPSEVADSNIGLDFNDPYDYYAPVADQ